MKFIKYVCLTSLVILHFVFFPLKTAEARLTPAFYGTSSLIPGLGHIFNGQFVEGVTWFAFSYGLVTSKSHTLRSIGQDIWFYNMYDAWKDAGGKPSTEGSIFYNYAQNFNPVNLFDPFSVGFVGIAISQRNGNDIENSDETPVLNSEALKSIAKFTFVGLGEEALFRGFLFPSLSSWMGIWGGAFTSSAIFGFLHEGTVAENSVRTLLGLALCWQYHRNNYRLAHNIFAHSWYDQFLIGPFSIGPSSDYEKQSKLLKDRPLGLQATFFF